MSEKKKTERMSSYSNKKDYVKRLEEAGDTSGRSKSDVREERRMDQIFDTSSGDKQPNDERSWVDKFFDYITD